MNIPRRFSQNSYFLTYNCFTEQFLEMRGKEAAYWENFIFDSLASGLKSPAGN